MNGAALEWSLGWSGGGDWGGVFFSTVLETNTVNKVKGKREGWVYITALQRTSICSHFNLRALTLCLCSSYSLMCRENQRDCLRATSVSVTWVRVSGFFSKLGSNQIHREANLNSCDPVDQISEHPVSQLWETRTLTQRHQWNHKNKSKATQML